MLLREQRGTHEGRESWHLLKLKLVRSRTSDENIELAEPTINEHSGQSTGPEIEGSLVKLLVGTQGAPCRSVN